MTYYIKIHMTYANPEDDDDHGTDSDDASVSCTEQAGRKRQLSATHRQRSASARKRQRLNRKQSRPDREQSRHDRKQSRPDRKQSRPDRKQSRPDRKSSRPYQARNKERELQERIKRKRSQGQHDDNTDASRKDRAADHDCPVLHELNAQAARAHASRCRRRFTVLFLLLHSISFLSAVPEEFILKALATMPIFFCYAGQDRVAQ